MCGERERRNIGGLARRLWRDRAGAAAVYMGVTIALVVAVGALVLDLGRLYTLGTEQENAADSAALSAAAELDGKPGAIASATLAAQGALVNNSQTFALGGHDVAVERIRFLKDLPSDDVVIDDSYVTTLDSEARFAEVTVETRAIANLLIGVVGGAPTSSTAAVAVAGYTRMMCGTPPLAVCNPAERGGNMGARFVVEDYIGKQLMAKAAGPNSAWTPGTFGLLDVDGSQSAKDIANLLATADPNTPCVGSTVDVKPGETEGTRSALNTRFDMYENPFFRGIARSNAEFRPARNVTKGLLREGGMCNYVDPNDSKKAKKGSGGVAMALPHDNNISLGNRFGNGVWDRTGYWQVNHPDRDPPPGFANMTRYELYEWEIDSEIPDNSDLIPLGEDGNPQCYSGSTLPSDDPDRRILYIAVLNCVEHGPITGTSAGPIPVEQLIKVFMTQPVSDPPDSDIWVEIVGEVSVVDRVFHDIVQLYR